MLEFGVADETAWQVGLSCGGRIKVYVETVELIAMESRSAPRRRSTRERRARRAAIAA